MIQEDTIYCVGCSSVVEIEKAEIIFRTGFYKVSMQLGICKACDDQSEQLEQLSMLEPMNHYELFM